MGRYHQADEIAAPVDETGYADEPSDDRDEPR
jgi:hypothetical protein